MSRAAAGLSAIFPAPRFIRRRSSRRVKLKYGIPLFTGESVVCTADRWAIRPLLVALKIKSSTVKGLHDRPLKSRRAEIIVGGPQDGPELRALFQRLKAKLPQGKLGQEGYLLSVDSDGLKICAEAPSGVYYAVQTLLQLLRSTSTGATTPAVEIADVPAYPFRGIYMSTCGPENLLNLKKFIRKVLPFHKVNTMVLGLGYHFLFRSHPEIQEDSAFTREQVRMLVDLCRKNNIKLIPLLNCLGHQSWRTARIGALLRAYPEFNETPGKQDLKYCYSWCPSNKRVYAVVYDLLDELIEAFDTDAIHLGMDEVFEFGECPRCRGKTNAELFAKAVNDLYAHVTGRRKVRMMIWGDRLIDGRKTPYNDMNGARNGTHTAMRKIPKDIFLCDWHYHLHESYPSAPRFDRAGFDYVSCSYKKPDAVDAFMAYAAKYGGRHYLGHLDTNWEDTTKMLRCLLSGKTGVLGEADAFRRGMELAWRGAHKIRAPKPPKEKAARAKAVPTDGELY